MLGIFSCVLSSAAFSQNQLFSKKKGFFRNTFRVSNSFDQDQDRQDDPVGPDQDPNCLADYKSRRWQANSQVKYQLFSNSFIKLVIRFRMLKRVIILRRF